MNFRIPVLSVLALHLVGSGCGSSDPATGDVAEPSDAIDLGDGGGEADVEGPDDGDVVAADARADDVPPEEDVPSDRDAESPNDIAPSFDGDAVLDGDTLVEEDILVDADADTDGADGIDAEAIDTDGGSLADGSDADAVDSDAAGGGGLSEAELTAVLEELRLMCAAAADCAGDPTYEADCESYITDRLADIPAGCGDEFAGVLACIRTEGECMDFVDEDTGEPYSMLMSDCYDESAGFDACRIP